MAYASESEFLSLGLPGEAVAMFDTATIESALAYASRVADSYLAKRYPVPLTEWGEDIKRVVIDLAQYDLMARRGFRPASGADEIVIKRRDDAIEWLKLVAKKLVEPTGVVEATPQIATPISSTDERINWDFQTRRKSF